MKFKPATILGLTLLMAGQAVLAKQDEVPLGAVKMKGTASDFSAKGTDGKTYSLGQLRKNGPVFLYFIKVGCPVNGKHFQWINEIAKFFGAQQRFVGVINDSLAGAKTWKKEHKAPYLILSDPELTVIGRMGVIASPWVIQIDKSGKFVQRWQGGSKTSYKQISASMAKSLNRAVPNLALKGAPAATETG